MPHRPPRPPHAATAGYFEGYRIIETGERVNSFGVRWFRLRAELLAQRNQPLVPSYRLEVEKVGRLRYEVVAYQNRLDSLAS